MSSDFPIETRGLRKSYRTGGEVLSGLDMKVPRGSVFGFLGRNGAGKSTTIRILMGLLRPDHGSVRVLGDDRFPLSVTCRQRIGYLSQDQRVFEWMSLDHLLRFVSDFYPTWDHEFASQLTRRLDLTSRVPLGQLSRGQQQKVGLLLALVHRPELLVLDEPAASLDTIVRREFLESILDLLTSEGITVLISSQILTDVERIADWIGILAGGRMIVSAPLDSLKDTIKRLRIRFDEEPSGALGLPGSIREVRRGSEVLVTLRDFSQERLAEIRSSVSGQVDVQDVDLEEIFIELAT